MSGPCIRLENLSKSYGSKRALEHLSLEVNPGEIFGFLGANGAGKTTTIRILLDLVRPTGGQAFVFGKNCQTESLAVRNQIGYLPGDLSLYGELSGRKILDFLASMESVPVERRYQLSLLERLDFHLPDLDRKIRDYSTGMRRKIGIVQALQANRPLLILDEPTEGLDPLARDEFHQLLQELKKEGRTIFMSSHVLSEVERVCERIAVVRAGKLALLSDTTELRLRQQRVANITFSREVHYEGPAPAGAEWISRSPRLWQMKVQGPLAPTLQFLGNYPVEDLRVDEPKLEEFLIGFYQEEKP